MNMQKLLPLTVLALALPIAACGGGGTEATTKADKAPATPKVEQAEPAMAEPAANPKPKKVKHLPALAHQINPGVAKKLNAGEPTITAVKSIDCIEQTSTTAKCTVGITGDERDADGSLTVARFHVFVNTSTGKLTFS